MPWYPQPGPGYVSGFFDGGRWAAALTDDRLMVDGTWLAIDEIAEVGYLSEDPDPVDAAREVQPWGGGAAGTGTRRPGCRFRAADIRGRSVTVSGQTFPYYDDATRGDLWQGLVDISHHLVEPRIARRIVDRLAAGGELEFAGHQGYLRLLASGFTASYAGQTRAYGWPWFHSAEVDPFYGAIYTRIGSGEVRVYARSESFGSSNLVARIATELPNAVTLGTLMPMCAAVFGAR